MKNLLLSLALAAIVASCGTKDEPKAFKIKDTDMISIRPAKGTAMKAPATVNVAHLTALEIVKQTNEISLFTKTSAYGDVYIQGGRSFTSEQRDTISETPKLLMWATDVIMLDGQLQTEWIIGKDVVFVKYNTINYQGRDTIAYIPNSVLRTAETAIRKAYADKDIDACYRVFNEAYTFTPITGAEWRALKAAGQN